MTRAAGAYRAIVTSLPLRTATAGLGARRSRLPAQTHDFLSCVTSRSGDIAAVGELGAAFATARAAIAPWACRGDPAHERSGRSADGRGRRGAARPQRDGAEHLS